MEFIQFEPQNQVFSYNHRDVLLLNSPRFTLTGADAADVGGWRFSLGHRRGGSACDYSARGAIRSIRLELPGAREVPG